MIKTIKNKNWALDIVKTEEWLNRMQADGFALQAATLPKGKFVFASTTSESVNYKIGYGENNMPKDYEFGYREVCRCGNYFVLRTNAETAQLSPSLNELWDKNVKRKFIIGLTLLSIYLCLQSFSPYCLFLP